MSLGHSHLSANELMTHNIMLHSAMGDSVVAFRHIVDFSEKHKDSDINLIYNKNIDPFMKHWVWPPNITLMPLEQTMHDFDNVNPFPYKCDNKSIEDSFHAKENNAHDFRPFFIERDHKGIENNLKDFIPDQTPLLHGLGQYVVIQPLSTIHESYSTRWIDEELQTYEKFLINLIDYIHLHTSLSIAVVGIPEDGAKFPHLMVINSHPRYFNLIGHLGIQDLCTVIGWSSAVLGLSSSATNIGNSIFEKPVISWRLKPSFGEEWGDLFDNFIEGDSKAIARPWEQEMNFYSNFLKKYEKSQKIL